MKYVLLFVIGVVLVMWLMKGHRRRAERPGTPPPAHGSEDMVRCDHCGVHLPRSESITTRGRFFCTPEHRQLHENL